MDEKQIMQLITSEQSWEQILYKVIAWEGMDPWDLDIIKLSETFMTYLVKLEELDFNVPAKYVIIAAVLLRMKSEQLEFMELVEGEQPEYETFDDTELDGFEPIAPPEITPIGFQPKRFARRKIMASELLDALKRALKSQDRKKIKRIMLEKKIQISQEDVTKRIDSLYSRINKILEQLKKGEVEFSKIVKKWERKEIVDTFLPLMHLDHDKKVVCRQDDMFGEIMIKKG